MKDSIKQLSELKKEQVIEIIQELADGNKATETQLKNIK